MDPSAHPHASRPASTDDTNPAFPNDLYNGFSFNNNTLEPQYEFSWDDRFLQTSEEPQPVYAPPNSSWLSTPQQNVVEPSATQYGFNPTFENHSFSQPPPDPRMQPQIQNQLQSQIPNQPYQNFSYNPTISYPHQNFQNQFQSHSPSPFQQQRTPIQHVQYAPQHLPQQYLRYTPSPGAHPNLQGINVDNIPSFGEHGHISQFGQPTIDPQFLTANDTPQIQASNFQTHLQTSNSSNYGFDISNIPQGSLPPSALTPQNIKRELPPLAQAQNGILVPAKPPKAPAKPRKKKDPAVKAPRGRPKKDASKTSTQNGGSVSGGSDSSDYESDDLEIEMPSEPKPRLLDGPRPEDPEQQTEWDAARALWSPRNKPAIEEGRKQGVILFAKLVKGIRDNFKAKNDALKEAETNKQEATLPFLRKEVSRIRGLIEIAAKSALEHGHPSYIERLGENPFTMIAFQTFLVDRNAAGDNDGSTTLSILKLVSRFATLDQDLLEKTKSEKVLARLSKKAGDEVKSLAQKVLDNSVAATRRLKEQPPSPTKPITTQSPQSAPSPPNSLKEPKKLVPQVVIHKKVDHVAGAKRPREQENGIPPPTKRPVAATNAKPSTTIVSKPPLALSANLKREKAMSPDSSKVAKPTNDNATIKSKSTNPLSKPTSALFQTLASASKKPGTSNAARLAAAKEKASVAAVEKKEPPPAPTPAPVAKPAFSFAETLANLHKPKEVEEKKEVDDRPPESEEERRRRLRKEERRKLRVTWKPEDTLTEIRLFVHDPDEEISHGDSSRRDVGDVKGEGRMLKMHKDLDDLEEEEENNAGRPQELTPYNMPSVVDFSGIEPDERERNFSKRGGLQIAKSLEKDAQDQREASTLMVVYALPSDVPSTPKEPPASEDDYDPDVTITPFGEPGPETKVRAREAQYLASQAPKQGQQTDLTSLLSMIRPQQPQAPLTDLERTFNLFSQQQQAQPQPAPQAPSSAAGFDLTKILGIMNQVQQMQPQQAAPPQAAQQPAPNLAALLAQFGGQGQGQNAGGGGGNGFGFGQQNQFSQDDQNRKHDRGEYDDYGNGGFKRKKGNANPNPNPNPNTLLGKKHPKAGLVACRFWKEGLCKKGDECTFRHDD